MYGLPLPLASRQQVSWTTDLSFKNPKAEQGEGSHEPACAWASWAPQQSLREQGWTGQSCSALPSSSKCNRSPTLTDTRDNGWHVGRGSMFEHLLLRQLSSKEVSVQAIRHHVVSERSKGLVSLGGLLLSKQNQNGGQYRRTPLRRPHQPDIPRDSRVGTDQGCRRNGGVQSKASVRVI